MVLWCVVALLGDVFLWGIHPGQSVDGELLTPSGTARAGFEEGFLTGWEVATSFFEATPPNNGRNGVVCVCVCVYVILCFHVENQLKEGSFRIPPPPPPPEEKDTKTTEDSRSGASDLQTVGHPKARLLLHVRTSFCGLLAMARWP